MNSRRMLGPDYCVVSLARLPRAFTMTLGAGGVSMNNRMLVLAVLSGALLTAVGCTRRDQENRPEADLTEAEVLRIAEAAARSEGYDVDKYDMTGCDCESTAEGRTWTVSYDLKPPTPPGGHFMVSIDDKTRKATLARGE